LLLNAKKYFLYPDVIGSNAVCLIGSIASLHNPKQYSHLFILHQNHSTVMVASITCIITVQSHISGITNNYFLLWYVETFKPSSPRHNVCVEFEM